MVDAAVGGKTGINTAEGKNLVGAFHPPAGVLCDLAALDSLPGQRLRQRARRDHQGRIHRRPGDPGPDRGGPGRPPAPRRPAHRRADRARHPGQGRGRLRRPQGVRACARSSTTATPSAHAIEKNERYKWRHGAAVSVGMVFAAELGRLAGPAGRRHRRPAPRRPGVRRPAADLPRRPVAQAAGDHEGRQEVPRRPAALHRPGRPRQARPSWRARTRRCCSPRTGRSPRDVRERAESAPARPVAATTGHVARPRPFSTTAAGRRYAFGTTAATARRSGPAVGRPEPACHETEWHRMQHAVGAPLPPPHRAGARTRRRLVPAAHAPGAAHPAAPGRPAPAPPPAPGSPRPRPPAPRTGAAARAAHPPAPAAGHHRPCAAAARRPGAAAQRPARRRGRRPPARDPRRAADRPGGRRQDHRRPALGATTAGCPPRTSASTTYANGSAPASPTRRPAGTTTPRPSTASPAAPAASPPATSWPTASPASSTTPSSPTAPSSASAAGSGTSAPACCPWCCCPAWRSSWSATPSAAATAACRDEEVARIHGRMAGWYGSGLPIIDNSQLDVPTTAARPGRRPGPRHRQPADLVTARRRAGRPLPGPPGRSADRRPAASRQRSYARGMSEVYAARRDAAARPVRARRQRGRAGLPPRQRPLSGGRAPPRRRAAARARPRTSCCCAAAARTTAAAGPRPTSAARPTCCPAAGGDPAVAAADLAARRRAPTSLAVEEHHLTVARHRAIALGRPAAAPRRPRPAPSNSCGWSRTRRRSPACGSPPRSPTRPSASCWSRSWSAAPSGISPWSWSAGWSTTAPTARPSPPPWPPARTPGAAATGPPTGGSRRATSSPSASAPATAATAARSAVPSSSAPRRRTGRSSCTTWSSPPSGPAARRWHRVWPAATWTGRPVRCWTPAGHGEALPAVHRARGGTGNRRGPSVGPCGHG